MRHDDIDAAAIRIAPLTREHAEDLATWRYDPPYAVYDLAGADPDELLDPALGFRAVLVGERLIGFRSFGPDGQVPGWDYDDTALDTGGGIRPSFNARARRTVESLGFEQVGSFAALRDGRRFDVLVRVERPQT